VEPGEKDIIQRSFRNISDELERLSTELQLNEASIHRAIGSAPWAEVSKELPNIQFLDLAIQTLAALSEYSSNMANGIIKNVDHDAAISQIKLADLRRRLSDGTEETCEPNLTDQESVELF